MQAKGLCVKGLDVYEISKKLEPYVSDYFSGFKIGTNESLLQEGFLFTYDEVNDMIPAKHHHLFTDDCKLLGMSGYITLSNTAGKPDERILMVLFDEDSEYLYLVCLQEENEQGDEQSIIIADFITS